MRPIIFSLLMLSLPIFGMSQTVVDVIVGSEDHTILETAVIEAGLAGALSGDGPFTVFAPTDDAFGALEAGVLDALLLDPTGDLANILLYHVVEASAMSTDLNDGDMLTTMLGDDVTVTINMDGVFINDAQVTVANLEADNGIVHVIDAVLLPPAPLPATVVDIVVASEDHTILETAVIEAGLAGALSGDGPFTVFAPTDDAFGALEAGVLDALLLDPTGDLANILLYHVVEASAMSTDLNDGDMLTTMLGDDVTVTINMDGVFINDAQVTVANLEADNGIVHVIDAVLLPPAPLPATVVDIVVASEDHTILETAVIEAGLAGALSGDGPFTVFAPTDDAFGALEAGVLDALLLDPTGDLANILLYHVVEASAMSTDLNDGDMLTTMLGDDVTVTINMDGVFINDAQVTVANLEADNGIVHVIDAVLLPPAPLPATVVDIVVASEDHTILETAVIEAGLAGALSGDGPFTVFAPTDDAFGALEAGVLDALLLDPTGDLANILLYHVVEASAMSTDLNDGDMLTTMLGDDVTVTINMDGVFINDAQVTVANLEADNGIVHVIDAVLLPPAPLPATVVDIVVASEDHTILETAVIEAGLAGALSGDGPFTVFAPTDDAFGALEAGVLDALLLDPTGDLANILLYHVVEASAMSTDLNDGDILTTMLGDDVTVTINMDGVFINDAQVTVANLEADNGIVHVIDAVLLPTTTSTEDFEEEQVLLVYPNPTSGQINLGNNVKIGDVLMVTNAMGQTIMNQKITSRVLDLGRLGSGVYNLFIYTMGTVVSTRVAVK